MNKLLKALELAIVGFGWVARAAVLALVLMVACNVLLRYVFSWSPVAAQELEWHLISPIALLGMAYAVYHRADVRVDFIYDRLGARSQAVIDLVSGVFTLAVGVIIAWLAVPYVMQAYDIGEVSPDPGGLPMRYLVKAFIPLGFSLLALQGLIDTLRAAATLISGAPHTPHDSLEIRT
ncbi:MAG: C4-dicarboxylate ABC transporter permease [Azoarcus sp.]|nr:MAG: C4-dicarboxylate ABC transporter permease [Azoarcus sp.]TVT57881.1 MAG: TRAP transporter small permease subunit [Azoarcus sp. PHD]